MPHKTNRCRADPEKVNAEIYRLSQMPDLLERIAAMRVGATAMRKYHEELRKYNKRRRGRPEVEVVVHPRDGGFSYRTPGIVVSNTSVPRPQKPGIGLIWDKSKSFCGGRTSELGLLANGGKYNRPINSARVQEFVDLIVAGEWRDLLSDPIAITSDGEVINGQHRLAAIGQIESDGSDGGYDPRFLVLFDVSRNEIPFMDTSKRTERDLSTIARKAIPRNGAAKPSVA